MDFSGEKFQHIMGVCSPCCNFVAQALPSAIAYPCSFNMGAGPHGAPTGRDSPVEQALERGALGG